MPTTARDTVSRRLTGLLPLGTACAVLLQVTNVSAQILFPQQGVSVTTTGPAPAIPAPTAQPAPQVAKPAPKPKPKPVATASVADDAGPKAGGQAIVMVVNDEPITAYEIEMRTRFLAASSNVGAQAQENFKRIATSEATATRLKALLEKTIQENQGKTREQILVIWEARKKEFGISLQKQALEGARASQAPKFRKEAQEELIEERLKMQEARKLGVVVSDEDISRVIKDIAQRNKVTEAQFAQNLKNVGTDISVMRARFAASLAWRDVVRRKFSAQISVNQRDVDKFLAQKPGETPSDTAELQVQKITLPLPSKLDQAAMAQKLADADGLRRKFGGCKTTGTLAGSLSGARFEDLKYIRPSTIGEPTRSFLLSAKDGDMLPPQTGSDGLEVYTVCGRRAIAVDEKKRDEAQAELASREFEQLAKRHLRDLRQDALIETR